MEWINENIIALVAVLISGITALYSYFQGRKSNDLQERVVDLEEQRELDRIEEANQASIVPRFTTDREYTGKVRHKLSICNEGAAEARNIRVSINDDTPTEFPHIIRDHDIIGVIASGNQFDYIIARDGDTDPVWRVEVTWDDAYEENRRIETDIGI